MLLVLLLINLSFCLGLSVSAPPSLRLTLALFLCWLVVVRSPPFCLLVRLSILLVAVLLWVLRLRLILRCWVCLNVRFNRLWVSCRWSGRPLCMLPVCLAGCSWRSRFRVLFVLLSPSLSLLFPDPALSPLGTVPCWLRCLSLVPSTLVLRLVIFLVGCLFVSLRFLRGWRPVVALSRLRGGVQIFCFPVAPSQSVLPALSGSLGGLPGSLLCLPPGYGSSCFHGSLWFGLVLQLPSMRVLRSASLRSLGCSTVSYLGSRRYGLSSTLVFSVTLPVGSSWAPLSRFSWSRAFLQTGVVSSA